MTSAASTATVEVVAVCERCGKRTHSNEEACSLCRTPIPTEALLGTEDDAMGEQKSGTNDIRFLGTNADPARRVRETEPGSDDSTRRWSTSTAAAMAAVAVVALLSGVAIGWSGSSSGQSAPTTDRAQEQADTDDSGSVEPARSSTTTDQSVLRADDFDAITIPPQSLSGRTWQPTMLDGAALPAEEMLTINFAITIGGTGEGLVILDPRTGKVVVANPTTADPIMATATHLIISEYDVAALPFDAIDGQPWWIPGEFHGTNVYLASHPDQVWLSSWGDHRFPHQLFLADLASREIIEVRDYYDRERFITGGNAELFSVEGGGIYTTSSEGNRRLAYGSAWSASDNLILVNRCDAELACEFAWIDRETGDPVDLLVPPGSDWHEWESEIDPTGRFMFLRRDSSSEIFEIATGRVIPTEPGWVRNFEFSTDALWAAVGLPNSSIDLIALQTGETYRIVLPDDDLSFTLVPRSVFLDVEAATSTSSN